MTPDSIIIAPILTEKSNALREAGVYTFRVDPRANKIQIKQAVQQLFNVHATDCRVVSVKGKPKRRGAIRGTTSSWKKAIVRVADGEKISIFEGA